VAIRISKPPSGREVARRSRDGGRAAISSSGENGFPRQKKLTSLLFPSSRKSSASFLPSSSQIETCVSICNGGDEGLGMTDFEVCAAIPGCTRCPPSVAGETCGLPQANTVRPYDEVEVLGKTGNKGARRRFPPHQSATLTASPQGEAI